MPMKRVSFHIPKAVEGVEVVMFRLMSIGLKIIALSIVMFALAQGTTRAQDQERSTSNSMVQKIRPVGEEEAKPSKAVPPVSSVVGPGIIPSRQSITSAGLQSIFESRVNGVAFGDKLLHKAEGRRQIR